MLSPVTIVISVAIATIVTLTIVRPILGRMIDRALARRKEPKRMLRLEKISKKYPPDYKAEKFWLNMAAAKFIEKEIEKNKK